MLYQCKNKQQGLQAEGAASKRNPILTSYKQPTKITVLIKHCMLFHTIYITPVQSTFWLPSRCYGGPTQPADSRVGWHAIARGNYEKTFFNRLADKAEVERRLDFENLLAVY